MTSLSTLEIKKLRFINTHISQITPANLLTKKQILELSKYDWSDEEKKLEALLNLNDDLFLKEIEQEIKQEQKRETKTETETEKCIKKSDIKTNRLIQAIKLEGNLEDFIESKLFRIKIKYRFLTNSFRNKTEFNFNKEFNQEFESKIIELNQISIIKSIEISVSTDYIYKEIALSLNIKDFSYNILDLITDKLESLKEIKKVNRINRKKRTEEEKVNKISELDKVESENNKLNSIGISVLNKESKSALVAKSILNLFKENNPHLFYHIYELD